LLPNTWAQILVLLAAVVPGFVYQITRRALRGPSPDEIDVTIRVLRAVATSALFVAVYFLVLGRWLVQAFDVHDLSKLGVRTAALSSLSLVLVIPWVSARLVYYLTTATWWVDVRESLIERLGLRRPYDPTPSSWDFLFSRAEWLFARADGSGCWIRLLTADGQWVGGWFGGESFASSFPHARDIFIEKAYELNSDGRFTGRVTASGGVYVRCDDIRLLDFPTNSPEEEQQDNASSAPATELEAHGHEQPGSSVTATREAGRLWRGRTA
jgi:hypothetical protein